MKGNWFSMVFLISCMILSIVSPAESADYFYYVAGSPIGDDNNDGLTPGAPFETIQHAINIANGTEANPVTIRIAAGIYNEQIVMDSHESLEGGWDNSFSARRNFTDSNLDSDPTASSIIDGESFRRCMVIYNVEGINVNGLTIQHGYSDDGLDNSDIWDGNAAGVNCIDSTVSFNNCSFLDNVAFSSGSGLHSIDSWVRVNGCRFNMNLCDSNTMGGGGGGALYHSGGTLNAENSAFTYNEAYYNNVGAIYNDADNGWIKGCRFSHNGSKSVGGRGIESGAALYNTGPSALIANCIFEHNYAEHFGAMRNWGSEVTIINCLFNANITEEGWPGGGALQNIDSNVSVYNSTFINNVINSAGAIYGGHIGNFSSSLEVLNSIFWFHKEWLDRLDPWNNITAIRNSDSTSIVSHCIIDDDEYVGVDGNIWEDPLFSGNTNFRLRANSPSIDAGSGELTLPPDTADIDNDGNKTESIPIDLDGNPRIDSGIVDMGAYEYEQPKGALKVTLYPSGAVSAGAQWRVDGGSWQDSGFTQENLAVGDHTVEFKDIPGWSTPGNQTATISDGQITSLSGTYIQQMGSLKVDISPAAAVSAGAQWLVDGGTWRNSGYIQRGLSVGSHTVSFKNVSGWAKPANKVVSITNGQTTSTSGTYTQQTGSLRVTIVPSRAVSAGAQWRVDGGTWKNSGSIVSGLAVGSHTVEFKEITGWTAPEPLSVNIKNGLTASVSGYYPKDFKILTLLSPNGGEIIPSGSKYSISWNASSDIDSFKLQYSINNGKSWKKIANGITGTTYYWIVPTFRKNKRSCLVKIVGYDASGEKVKVDKTDAAFTIEVISITSPNGGETLTSGATHNIAWDTHETKKEIAKVVLKYTKNGGRKWEKIKEIKGKNPGTYLWMVPEVPKTKNICKVKVFLKDKKGKSLGKDTSDNYFSIEP